MSALQAPDQTGFLATDLERRLALRHTGYSDYPVAHYSWVRSGTHWGTLLPRSAFMKNTTKPPALLFNGSLSGQKECQRVGIRRADRRTTFD